MNNFEKLNEWLEKEIEKAEAKHTFLQILNPPQDNHNFKHMVATGGKLTALYQVREYMKQHPIAL